MVTRLEQYEEDGTSKVPPDRWSVDVLPLRTFSLSDYIRALFQANPGYYRIIIFVVTPVPFVESSATVSRDEAMEWLRTGLNKLPASLNTSHQMSYRSWFWLSYAEQCSGKYRRPWSHSHVNSSSSPIDPQRWFRVTASCSRHHTRSIGLHSGE